MAIYYERIITGIYYFVPDCDVKMFENYLNFWEQNLICAEIW
jgi:hypothetical protein